MKAASVLKIQRIAFSREYLPLTKQDATRRLKPGFKNRTPATGYAHGCPSK
jgi:hypothetical protein